MPSGASPRKNPMNEQALKKGEALFRCECRFAYGADHPGIIPPPTIKEIAFAGRSNVGKSSLLNALTGRRALARTSNTPGRTQQINFFELDGQLYLVDLPGYGYAKASKERVHAWNDMVFNYLQSRMTLKRVCVLIDARHGIKDIDDETMAFLDSANVPYAVIMTKADKLKAAELAEVVTSVIQGLKSHACAHPEPFVTSSDKKTGIPELRAFLASV
jgi:GTP-binding protein